jgi:multidrug efflux system outer membrane protein
MKMTRLFLLSVLVLTMAGCTMIPGYQRPDAPISDTWPDGKAGGTNAADLGWREFFTDARLQKIIELALANNRDLRVAALNVEKVQAQYRIMRSALFPELDAGAGFSRQRIARDVARAPDAVYQTQYSINGAVTAYELDLFGRVRSLKEAALEQFFAAGETRKSAELSLVAEVATQYLAKLQLEEQLRLANNTLKVTRAAHDAIKAGVEAGVLNELDLQAAIIQMETARADLARYRRLAAQADNALTLLAGVQLPDDLPAAADRDFSSLLTRLSPGLPSDLLLNRPDIMAAEHRLKAANADIGAARAAFFPKILLTGSAGTASAQLGDLFTGPSFAWSFMPQITVPIFDGGKNLANLDAGKISKRIEIANYQKTIQTAFREVADALAARATVNAELNARQALADAQQKRRELSESRYREGVDNYLGVLTAQQDFYAARQDLIVSKFYQLTNQVALYKALGGGNKAYPQ